MSGPALRRSKWAASSLLANLSATTAEALLSLGTAQLFEADRVLLREGEMSTHVILLLDGCVKVTATTAEGGFALLAIRVGGEIIGELASLDGQPRSATVTTAGLVRARLIAQASFHGLLAQYPDAAVAISRSVGGKLRWATQRRIDFSGLEVRVRLARVLVELAAAYGLRTVAGVEIGVALTQPELAALVGAAEPTVHKALAEFRRHRMITTGYRCIRVTDLSALQAVAGFAPP